MYARDLKNGSSSNWRADWARFAGKTYAQVVKAKNGPAGQNQAQSKQAVTQRQFKPTALVQKHKVVPVSCPVTKNVASIKQVKCKKVKNMTGLKPLPKRAKLCDTFHCQTKNRFALLASSVESSENRVNTVPANLSECSPKKANHIKTHHIVTNLPSKPVLGRDVEVGQKSCQNNSEHIGENHQKHSKFCSKNNTTDDKYDLALQTKNKNKIKMQQAKEDPTFDLWDQQTEGKFGYIPLGPLAFPKSDKKLNKGWIR